MDVELWGHKGTTPMNLIAWLDEIVCYYYYYYYFKFQCVMSCNLINACFHQGVAHVPNILARLGTW